MRRLSKYFFGLDTPFELKIFQVAAFGGMLAAFAGCFTSWYSGLPLAVVLVTLCGGFAAGALMVIAKRTRKVELCSCVLIFVLNMVILPLAFFSIAAFEVIICPIKLLSSKEYNFSLKRSRQPFIQPLPLFCFFLLNLCSPPRGSV